MSNVPPIRAEAPAPARPDELSTPDSASREPAKETLLRDFLASHDVRCPACRYALKGCEDRRCPECGWQLALQLRPTVARVPYTVFSLLVHGWLLLVGLLASASILRRILTYHSASNMRAARQARANQNQTIINQFLSTDSPGTPGFAQPAPASVFENARVFLLGQSGVDQAASVLAILSVLVGAIGLLMIPTIRTMNDRRAAWAVSAGIAVFVAHALHYVINFITIALRQF